MKRIIEADPTSRLPQIRVSLKNCQYLQPYCIDELAYGIKISQLLIKSWNVTLKKLLTEISLNFAKSV